MNALFISGAPFLRQAHGLFSPGFAVFIEGKDGLNCSNTDNTDDFH